MSSEYRFKTFELLLSGLSTMHDDGYLHNVSRKKFAYASKPFQTLRQIRAHSPNFLHNYDIFGDLENSEFGFRYTVQH